MFFLGFLVGVVITAGFILYGDAELLIRLSHKMKSASDRFWESRKTKTPSQEPDPPSLSE